MNTVRIEDILGEALAWLPGERARRLDEACGDDAELRAEVESLLEAHEQAGVFMAAPSVEESALGDSGSPGEGVGTVVGRYRLLQLIGEGGFGSVFMAEQREPVHRRVAVKIIKLGMDTKQVIARFEAERQALAMMDHPNIAHVLDAGATEAGRPYFVMELVRGEPITEFCDRETLSIRHRLDLFRQVCSAVQHAHQKGIIHRDLKPSNILVGEIDGRPTPKIIDFGIAKATGGTGLVLTDKTLFTDFRQFIGTPEYMSPEQAGKGAVDIDTRSDIYALGVLLYELVTGGPPFDPKLLRSAAWEEMRRIIREDEPDRPSTRLHSGEDSREVAARRRTEPARLIGQVRGDLDWIVMKCLEKDRSRRYETANALAMDLGRHLAGEPVVAAPPSRAYRLRKFASRNRGSVAAGLAIALVLVLGTIGTSAGLVWALRAEDRAERRANELAQITEFQSEQLSGLDPAAMGLSIRDRLRENLRDLAKRRGLDEKGAEQLAAEYDALVAGADFTGLSLQTVYEHIFEPAFVAIDRQFGEQPRVRASLLQTLATTLREAALLDRATAPQSEALRIRRCELGDDHPLTLHSINSMAALLSAQGKFDESEAYYEEAEERFRRVLGDEHARTISLRGDIGQLLAEQGRRDEAEAYYGEALVDSRRMLGEEHPHTITLVQNMGSLLYAIGRRDEAAPYYHEALEKYRRVLGEDHPWTLVSINNMADLLKSQGKGREAEALYREVLETRRRVLGERHPDTLASLLIVGMQLRAKGKLEEAEPYFREVLEKARRVLGDEHPNTLIAMNNMGKLLQDRGKLDEAQPYLSEALEKMRHVLGDEHPSTLHLIANMGYLLKTQGKLDQAEPLYREVLEIRRRVLGEEHPRTLRSINRVGTLLRKRGKFAEAEEMLVPAAAVADEKLPPDHRVGKYLTKSITELYDAWDEAEPGQGHDAKAAEWRARLRPPAATKSEGDIPANRGVGSTP